MKPQQTALLAILAVTLVLRLWGVTQRLPDSSLGISPIDDSAVEETDRTTMGRAWAMWEGGARPLDPNPHTGGWPALSFYLTFLIQVLYKGWWQIRHGFSGTAAFVKHVQADPGSFFLFARLFGVGVGVVTVWLCHRVASKAIGPGLALIAVALLAINPQHVFTSQHISDPNLLSLLFILLAALPMIRIGAGGGIWPSTLSGALIGFAGGCKYVPLLVSLPLLWTHIEWWRSAPPERKRVVAALVAGLVAMGGAFFISSPYLFLDYSSSFRSVTMQVSDVLTEWTGQGDFPIALPAYLTRVIPASVGWPAFLLGLGGLSVSVARSRKLSIMVLIPAVLILGNGVLHVAQERYILPAIPFLLMGAAVAIGALVDLTGAARVPIPPRAVTVVLVTLIVLPAIFQIVGVRRALALPDTRHLSRRWVVEHLPPTDPMVVELYGPVVNSGRLERLAVTWPFYAVGPARVRPAYHPEFLDGIKFYAQSAEVEQRFQAQSRLYPVESKYYSWLSGNTRLVWTSDSLSASGPRIDVLALPQLISTRRNRDRVWREALSTGVDSARIGKWCRDLSRLFALARDWPRAAEWAQRGLEVAQTPVEPELPQLLAFALLQTGDPIGAELVARNGIELAPGNAALHLYRAVALQQMGRAIEAAVEFEASLRIAPNQEGWQEIQLEIDRLRGRGGK